MISMLSSYGVLLLALLTEAVPTAEMPVLVQSAAAAADPAVRWFSNELDLPCAPGWAGFLCNEKLLPEGWVPTDLPPITMPVRLNPVRSLFPQRPLCLSLSRALLGAREWRPDPTAPDVSQTAIDLVRLNAVQPGLVPPLATGFKVIDLEPEFAADLKRWNRDNLNRVDNIPQNLGAPDRRSRIISTDPDHVFHSRVVGLAGRLKNKITEDFEKLISEWIGQPVRSLSLLSLSDAILREKEKGSGRHFWIPERECD